VAPLSMITIGIGTINLPMRNGYVVVFKQVGMPIKTIVLMISKMMIAGLVKLNFSHLEGIHEIIHINGLCQHCHLRCSKCFRNKND